MEVSIILHKEEAELLSKYMKDNNIKTKAEAVRKCIEFASRKLSINDMICDIDNKINRFLYRENFKKKLLEQFYANMEFNKEVDVKTEQGLLRFYKNNDLYK
jgi:ribosomal protein L31E